ncbi:universal stress protein [Desertimonas flava]|uniref:universal stress protein n=1 Tax=Desertimonas flava TaxID=2064846 RepID=UPI000E353CBC|nr:universal stress protein [Desertimonas flava]
MSYPRIVVSTDGSDLSMKALLAASGLARRAAIPVTVLGIAFDDAERRDVTDRIERVTRAVGSGVDMQIDIATAGAVVRIPGAAARTIVEDADRDAALVCIASHGRGGIGVALLGSTTEEVLRESRRPVLVVGRHFRPPDHPAREGRLVVCVDGSDVAERALEPAIDWARQFGPTPWIVEVARRPDLFAPPSDGRESNYVHGLARRVPHAEWEILHADDVAAELADLPRRWPVDALVMASHGRGGMARVSLGSVTMSVVHHSARPVLIVPAGHRPAV